MSKAPQFRVLQGGDNTARRVDPRPEQRAQRFVPVELPAEESVFDRSMLIGLLLALLIGTPLTVVMLREVNLILPAAEDPVVEISIVEPTPEPEPEPEPPKVVEYKKPTRSAPAPTAEPIPEIPPKRFELTLDSTVSKNSSGIAVATGATPSAAPGSASGDPDAEAPAQVSYSRLEVAPRLKREFKAPYPEAARAEGIEGTVVMKLTINELGRVTQVRIVRGINDELDRATKSAARRLLFNPGMVDGEAVITTGYVLRYTWELNE